VIWQLDLLLFVILVVTSVIALRVADLLAAVAALAAYSLFAALLFAGMGAVDVAFVEAAIGAGVTGILFVAAVLVTTRRTGEAARRPAHWSAVGVIAVFVGLMLYASVGLPDRGDPGAPAHRHVSPAYIEGALADSATPNVVTALLADYRSHDTFGETLVIFTAGLACALILRRRPEQEPEPEPDRPVRGDAAP
jgi:multicomponent Na+:H+ antiporter subunit B